MTRAEKIRVMAIATIVLLGLATLLLVEGLPGDSIVWLTCLALVYCWSGYRILFHGE